MALNYICKRCNYEYVGEYHEKLKVCPQCNSKNTIVVSEEFVCRLCGYEYKGIRFKALKECPKCHKHNSFVPKSVLKILKSDEERQKQEQQKQAEIQQTIQENKSKGIACCPKCGSTSIQAVTKGFGLLRGFVGSGKVENYCLNCGNKWKPKG
ncbi:MAG: hypothetical protein ACI4VF_07285 [Lachnospirales bacterium]